ncbi:uncharacterized protein [Diadema antillarum]|uniref:uncharacterized protein n=1 Tax=Diadema antillarum TaxID=105358 RepID=UPI003A88A734
MSCDMEDSELAEPLPARGEADGGQSPVETLTTPKARSQRDSGTGDGLRSVEPKQDGTNDRSELGEAMSTAKGQSDYDPLAEAAMNILRTQKHLDEADRDDEDDAFLDYGDSDSLGSEKQLKHIECAIGSDGKATDDLSKHVEELHIDIPEPVVKLKRRSSSIAELSDVEATGCVERFSPREDPVGSAGGSLPFHGTLTREGDMVSYVADDITEKIRQSVGSSRSTSGATSPAYPTTSLMPSWATTPTSLPSSSSSTTELGSGVSASGSSASLIPPIDPSAIQDLEKQCKLVADNLDLMLGHLSNSLHNMSAITVGHIQTYRDAVEKAGITVDQSVKAMYALMAKVEELNFAMPVVYDLAKQIKSLHAQLDELESLCK